ncbi:MAG: hypothetical protein K6D95_02610 [Treponema sp.]|nr:hypothetical protein [Treponema sp.]
MTKSDFFNEVYNRYGSIKRARGCYLYTNKGIRLTDLYQEEGRAILGWEGGSAFTFLKNILSRGQTGSFICEDHSRLEKAVCELLSSDRKIFCFHSKSDALNAGLVFASESTSVYRPWNSLNQKEAFSNTGAFIIAPPLPWSETNYILAVSTRIIEENPDKLLLVKGAVNLPFALAAAYTKSIYNLIKALQERTEKDWFIFDPVLTKYWERQGPYLYPKLKQSEYSTFVLHCLDCGIVISPDYNTPSIVPFGADRGVFTKLKNSPFSF